MWFLEFGLLAQYELVNFHCARNVDWGLFDQTISLPKWLNVYWMVKLLSSRLFLFYVCDNCFGTSYVQSDWRKSSAKKSNKRLTIRIWTVCLDMYVSEVCSSIWISPSSMSKIVVSQNIDNSLNRFCMNRYVFRFV